MKKLLALTLVLTLVLSLGVAPAYASDYQEDGFVVAFQTSHKIVDGLHCYTYEDAEDNEWYFEDDELMTKEVYLLDLGDSVVVRQLISYIVEDVREY